MMPSSSMLEPILRGPPRVPFTRTTRRLWWRILREKSKKHHRRYRPCLPAFMPIVRELAKGLLEQVRRVRALVGRQRHPCEILETPILDPQSHPRQRPTRAIQRPCGSAFPNARPCASAAAFRLSQTGCRLQDHSGPLPAALPAPFGHAGIKRRAGGNARRSRSSRHRR